MEALALQLAAAVTADDGVEIRPGILDFIHTPFDPLAVTSIVYAQTSELTETVTVPGSNYEGRALETVTRGRPHLLIALRRWYGCVWTAHRHGYSFRGQFTAQNFMISESLHVKMTGVRLYRFSRFHGGLDYTALVNSVEHVLTLQEAVPPAIRVWLDLIAEGVNGYEYLIRYHVALMEPRQAFDFVLEARTLLFRLRAINPFVYRLLLSFHPEFDGWNTDSNPVNAYMAAARLFVDPQTGNQIEFEEDLTGVLTLVSHCGTHPARYLKHFMVLIIDDEFPGLVARFQLNVFRACLMQHFCLEATME